MASASCKRWLAITLVRGPKIFSVLKNLGTLSQDKQMSRILVPR